LYGGIGSVVLYESLENGGREVEPSPFIGKEKF
jgi:hypothetical protein